MYFLQIETTHHHFYCEQNQQQYTHLLNCHKQYQRTFRYNLQSNLEKVSGLKNVVNNYIKPKNEEDRLFFMELLLFGLVEYSYLSKNYLERGLQFNDLLSSMISSFDENDEEMY